MRKMLVRILVLIIAGLLPGIMTLRSAADQGVLRATLKNGLRVVIVRNAIAPVVTTQINYLVGSNEAPQGFPGIGKQFLGIDLVADGDVVASLRLQHVRDGR